MFKKIYELCQKLQSNSFEIGKLKIFNHDTLDEADPKFERRGGDIIVEIGGPSTHIKFGVRTRAEHTIIKDAVTRILMDRETAYNAELDKLCTERIEKSPMKGE